MAAEGGAQALQGLGGARRGRRVGDVEPDLVAAEPDGIAPEGVAADQGLAALQVELPVVPVAGQDAALGQAALHQRKALVGAAVVAGEDPFLAVEQGDLLAPDLDQAAALRRQVLQRADVDQLRLTLVRHGISPCRREFLKISPYKVSL